jgi:hypothetical protein
MLGSNPQIDGPGPRTSGIVNPCPPVSSTNKTDRHDIAEILLKVALNTMKQTNNHNKEQL